ncbi:hypothetical protein GKZ90_0011080 [Flavobacterium sp. MC2016-06]|jgi:hypothetical protein|uniref:hypothetical protein n=1 Tax=Flavobacterium sp. MC2016-06 TaxID=2676308 RepID=UPI0012BA8E10|nr:hypothetical protein [Flavobacterium sp. MC2016-06]MBU3858645.1 hypothetical protein [Flavobacterium sp. MC2016-06]
MSRQKALFIGIGFYDYDQAIISEFNSLGYDVDYFSEFPAGIPYRYYLRRNNKDKIESYKEKTSMDIANSCKSNYDLIFVIKGECLSQRAIDKIKSKNPNCKWVLYLWDSIVRIPQSKITAKNFDKVYSFDRADCLENKEFIFNPLFFRREYDRSLHGKMELKFDLYFLGWYHSDRLKLAKKIVNFCKKEGLSHKVILYTGYMNYLLHKVVGKELKGNKEYLVFKSITAKMNLDLIMKSKATLDIAHPEQTGLTMRTIELLGAQKKIITTNSDIVNYDFYDPKNILVIDRENPDFDTNFFKIEFNPTPEHILRKYSINEWLKRML